jgi:hypothetical protein
MNPPRSLDLEECPDGLLRRLRDAYERAKERKQREREDS